MGTVYFWHGKMESISFLGDRLEAEHGRWDTPIIRKLKENPLRESLDNEAREVRTQEPEGQTEEAGLAGFEGRGCPGRGLSIWWPGTFLFPSSHLLIQATKSRTPHPQGLQQSPE